MLDRAGNLHILDGKFTEVHGDQNNYNTGSTTYDTNSGNERSYNTTDSNNDSSWRDNRNRDAHQSSAQTMNTLQRAPHTEIPPRQKSGSRLRQASEMPEEVKRLLADEQERPNMLGTSQRLDLDATIKFLQQQTYPRTADTDSMDVDEEEERVPQTYHSNPFDRPVQKQSMSRDDRDPAPFPVAPSAGNSRFKSNDPFRRA